VREEGEGGIEGRGSRPFPRGFPRERRAVA
jgi:hypothetical protein